MSVKIQKKCTYLLTIKQQNYGNHFFSECVQVSFLYLHWCKGRKRELRTKLQTKLKRQNNHESKRDNQGRERTTQRSE